MKDNKLANTLMLLVPALLWGSAFSVRKMAAAYMTPFFFNSIRLYAGFLFVLAVYILIGLYKKKKPAVMEDAAEAHCGKPLSYQIIGGAACGIAFALGSICQQWGLYFTTAGKTGFITTLYTILVPILSWMFFKKKVGTRVWIGAAFAVTGLFFIAGGIDFHLSAGDTVIFVGAIFFAMQILLTGHFVQHIPVLLLNVIQLATAATISLIVSLFFEEGNRLSAVWDAAGIILYAGVLSIGVAYIFQGMALKKVSPSVAAIIISLESVFGAIFGAILLKENMSASQLSGCALIFTAVLVAQYEKGRFREAVLKRFGKSALIGRSGK